MNADKSGADLQAALGYRFRDTALLSQALTHRSAGLDHNNERLEFLGDAVLGLVVACLLYERFPDVEEGGLSRLRARLVRGRHLAVVARRLGLGAHLRLGSGERASGGVDRDSNLANALEAVIGAVYLDGGQAAAEAAVTRWLGDDLAGLDPDRDQRDAKTRLQELLQARQQPLPAYRVETVTGKPHDQIFTVTCSVALLPEPVAGQGSSRRRAEQAAAEQVLARLQAG